MIPTVTSFIPSSPPTPSGNTRNFSRRNIERECLMEISRMTDFKDIKGFKKKTRAKKVHRFLYFVDNIEEG